jgi:prophage antirepressor-like protein
LNQMIEDPEKLARITDGTILAKQDREPGDVRTSYYRQQKFLCENAAGEQSVFLVWTLFVLWKDNALDCWMNAIDVVRGLGYANHRVSELRSFLSHEDRIVPWSDIERYMFSAEAPDQPFERGYIEASENLRRTPFLTEEGLYEVYQFSPKCRPFRRTVANLLRYLRQSFGSVTAIVGTHADSERQRYEAEKREELDKLRNEYEERVNQLNENLRRLTDEKNATEEELRCTRAQHLDAQTSLEATRREHKALLELARRTRLVLQNPINFFPLSGRLKFGQEDSFCIVWVGRVDVTNQYPPTAPHRQERDLYVILCRQRRSLPDQLKALYGAPARYRQLEKLVNKGTVVLGTDHLEQYRNDRFSFLVYPCYDAAFNAPQHRRFVCSASNSIGFKSALMCSGRKSDTHVTHAFQLSNREYDIVRGTHAKRRCSRSMELLSARERADIVALRGGEDLRTYNCEECEETNRTVQESVAVIRDNVRPNHRVPLRPLFVDDLRSSLLAYNCEPSITPEDLMLAIEDNYNVFCGTGNATTTTATNHLPL